MQTPKKRLLIAMDTMMCGGIEKSVLALLRALPRERYEVTLLLLTRTPSVVLPLQWMLGVFALEWVRTAWVLVAARMQEGQPTARMLAILLGVALMTLLAALPLGRLKRDWETDRPSSRQEGDS